MSGTGESFDGDLDVLRQRCEAWRQAGDRLVTTNGCFDILHAGHIHTLLGARAEGDRLIVGLNSDSSVRALKGDDRPMVPEQQRAATLAALPFVDHVQIFSEERPDKIFEAVRPDVHVKGGDYVASELPEHDLITSMGGRLVIISEVPGPHSSDLLAAYRRRTAT
jgi:rfaE bifunctional protein nucleotidyltransferase chain/domain